MVNIAVLGSTGSIGVQTLDVVRRHKDKFRITALTGKCNVELMAQQVIEFKPDYVGMTDLAAAHNLSDILSRPVASGDNCLIEACQTEYTDTVLIAVVGFAGLPAVMECIRLGRQIALANKEPLVTAGELINAALDKAKMRILPVDSEHSAIFQCLQGQNGTPNRILLTASGGAFRDTPTHELEDKTAQDALRHPNWQMGSKITIDSATLMNKALEVIEAHWLFRVAADKIEVLIHRESIIHSMVEFADNSVIAQLSVPDMRIPILYALAYPTRLDSGVPALALDKISKLTFEKPDMVKYPCLQFAYDALGTGGTAATIMNAANEIAVEAFLQARIRYLDIYGIIESTMSRIPFGQVRCIEDIYEADRKARAFAKILIGE